MTFLGWSTSLSTMGHVLATALIPRTQAQLFPSLAVSSAGQPSIDAAQAAQRTIECAKRSGRPSVALGWSGSHGTFTDD